MPGVGDLLVGGINPIPSTQLENSHQLAIGTGSLNWLVALNFAGSARLILLIDSLAAPVAGPVAPDWFEPIAALATTPGVLARTWTTAPLQFEAGLWVVMSTTLTTPFTYVVAGATDGAFSAGINLA